MSWLGSKKIDDTLTFSVNTHKVDTGVGTDADGVPTYRVYEDETGTAILNGSMAKLDDDNTVGFYSKQLTLSAANGFEAGKSYNIYITATVNGIAGTMHHTFKMEVVNLAANVTQLGGVTQSLTDLKDFADAGYDPATNKVQGVVLVDTTTSNDDMRGTDSALTDKDGFSLAATGLDAIASTATGMVEIAKAVWDRVLTGATHNIATSAGRRLRTLQDFGVYEDGAVWVDEVAGTSTGIIDFEDATVTNRANDLDNAVTVAASVGLNKIKVQIGSSVTLTAVLDGYIVEAAGAAMDLGNQSIEGSLFIGGEISGIGTTTTEEVHFRGCTLGTMSIQLIHAHACEVLGTITHTLAGDYRYDNCHSNVIDPGIVTFAKTAGQAVTVQYNNWSGSIGFTELEATDTISITGDICTVDLGSPAGTVAVSICGIYRELINVGSAVVNLSGAILGSDVADILLDTADLQANQGDWATAAGFATETKQDIMQGDVSDILTDTGEIGTAGVGLSDLGGMSTGMKAEVNAECDTALIDYDPATHTELISEIDDVQTDIAALNNITAASVGALVVEGSVTLLQSMQLSNSANAGKASGMETTSVVLRDLGDTKNRITATVDSDGNRSVVTPDYD